MNFSIERVDWQSCERELHDVRYTVFVVGQNVPEELETDELDPHCVHFIARTVNGKPIGTARVDQEGHIGRVAVLEEHRGLGVGTALMVATMDHMRESGQSVALLNSQASAIPFYEKLGFEPCGDEFMEAGIPHVAMKKSFGKGAD